MHCLPLLNMDSCYAENWVVQGGTLTSKNMKWTLYCLTYESQSNYIRIYRNGMSIFATRNSGGATYRGPDVFAWNVGTDELSSFHLADSIFMDASVTDAQRQAIEGAIMSKFGLSAQLPADHPFRHSAPEAVPTPKVAPAFKDSVIFSANRIPDLVTHLTIDDLQDRADFSCATIPEWPNRGSDSQYPGVSTASCAYMASDTSLNGLRYVVLDPFRDVLVDADYRSLSQQAYTVCYMARLPGPAYERALSGRYNNWLFGHHDGT